MSHAQKKSEAQMHSFHNKFEDTDVGLTAVAKGCKVEALLKSAKSIFPICSAYFPMIYQLAATPKVKNISSKAETTL